MKMLLAFTYYINFQIVQPDSCSGGLEVLGGSAGAVMKLQWQTQENGEYAIGNSFHIK